MELRERYRGCLLGLAAGDALGTTVEFQPRGSFEPLTDIVGGGPFGLKAGEWTDDTSLALCLATSLVECGGFDAKDQMDRYCRWYREGYMGSNGTCVDIGTTTYSSLVRYMRTGEPFPSAPNPSASGNGGIMRLAPAALFTFPDIDAAEHFAAESSRTTHASPDCLDAARLLGRMLVRALAGGTKEEIALADADSFVGTTGVVAIARGEYLRKPEAQIVGSGHVVRSLEAALWCFMRTDGYREAVLLAANLGDDADTTAAVCGQLAGAHYGESSIPPEWLAKLTMADEIGALADRLLALAQSRQ